VPSFEWPYSCLGPNIWQKADEQCAMKRHLPHQSGIGTLPLEFFGVQTHLQLRRLGQAANQDHSQLIVPVSEGNADWREARSRMQERKTKQRSLSDQA
jgi:hypothetical protein